MHSTFRFCALVIVILFLLEMYLVLFTLSVDRLSCRTRMSINYLVNETFSARTRHVKLTVTRVNVVSPFNRFHNQCFLFFFLWQRFMLPTCPRHSWFFFLPNFITILPPPPSLCYQLCKYDWTNAKLANIFFFFFARSISGGLLLKDGWKCEKWSSVSWL